LKADDVFTYLIVQKRMPMLSTSFIADKYKMFAGQSLTNMKICSVSLNPLL